LIAGLVIVSVLILLILYSLIRVLFPQERESLRIGHRFMITSLGYCTTEDNKLCVVAFSQDVGGGMQVILQTPRPSYPEFVLTIQNDAGVSTYECHRSKEAPTTKVCTGDMQVPGQILQFTVLSRVSNTLLAEGQFAIIGVALLMPEVEQTATVEGTAETATGTPIFLSTVSPRFNTPTPTPLVPSYPNPTTYPNPSYP